MIGRVLSEQEIIKIENILKNNIELWGMQTDEETANLVTTIRFLLKALEQLREYPDPYVQEVVETAFSKVQKATD